MQQAFTLDKKLKEITKDKIIVIVDDISTTGSTLREACKEIYKASPKSIICLTLTKDTVY